MRYSFEDNHFTDGMSEKERKLYYFFLDKNNWRPPSYKMICEHLNLKSKNAASYYVKKLQKRGFIPKKI